MKKMSVISALVKGVSESVENKWKEKKIRKAIANSRDDANEKLEIAQDKLQMFPTKCKDLSPEAIVSSISEMIGEVEKQEAILKRLDKVEAYLNGEIEVDEDEE